VTASGNGAGRPDEGGGGWYTATDASNQIRFLAWLFVSMVAYVGATAAARRSASLPASVPWLLGGLSAVLGTQAIRRYVLFLRRADELLRKLELEALALGFASGAVTCLLLPLLERLGVPDFGEASTILLVMMAAWGLGSWLGMRRYWRGGSE
jgi:hypothetical protein